MRSRAIGVRVALLAGAMLLPSAAASGQETIAYSYDARGRLVSVQRSGTVNNGLNACYAYDKADNRTNVTAGTTACSTQTPPSFAVNDVSVTEGGSLIFSITKSGSTASSFSVNYGTADGSALAGSDYTATSGTLTFAAGDTAKTVTIATTDDTVVESAETLALNLSGASGGATISDSQGIGKINDNDTASSTPPSFAISDAYGVEGESLVFTVTKTGSTGSSFSVNFATANGTAGDFDYYATSGTLTFGAADTSKTITVATRNNSVAEDQETFYVNLSGATGGSTITDAQGVGTIDDDDSGGGGGCTTCL